MKLGDCVKFKKPGLNTPHCYFIVAEDANGSCVLVNMTTMGHICDKTVVLHVGDHPEVKHDSIILYSDAQITTFEVLDKLLQNGIVTPKPPCSSELLKKLQKGIADSPETKPKVRVFCGHPERVAKIPKSK